MLGMHSQELRLPRPFEVLDEDHEVFHGFTSPGKNCGIHSDSTCGHRDVDSSDESAPPTPLLGLRSMSMSEISGSQSLSLGATKLDRVSELRERFHLCAHYGKLLDEAMTQGFNTMNWVSGLTLLHYAAKKNNQKLITFLCNEVGANVHSVDAFMKKPIDYACPRKKDSVYYLLKLIMGLTPIPDADIEAKYQEMKLHPHGIFEKEKKAHDHIDLTEVMENDNIADGGLVLHKDTSLLTFFEVEAQIPPEYKKALKAVQGGDWDAATGKWPHGTTLLHWAARSGKDELCRFCVIECGADPHEDDPFSGKNAIDLARRMKHRKLAKQLITRFREPAPTKGKSRSN